MKLDYLEIGTSDFRTLVQELDTVGMSVEPIKYYLDRLPNKENNTKVNCAISPDGIDGETHVYYIPEKIINEKKLPRWLRGCNAVGDYHYQHKVRKLEDYVVKDSVKMISMKTLIDEYNIKSIKFLKIDTEGLDCRILSKFYDDIKDNPTLQPGQILFESNILTKKTDVRNIINLYNSIGYNLIQSNNDTLLSK